MENNAYPPNTPPAPAPPASGGSSDKGIILALLALILILGAYSAVEFFDLRFQSAEQKVTPPPPPPLEELGDLEADVTGDDIEDMLAPSRTLKTKPTFPMTEGEDVLP